jgi:O-antigen ligase
VGSQRLAIAPVFLASAVLTAATSLVIFRMGLTTGLVFALIPLGLVAAVVLVGSGRIVLYAAVFAAPLSGINALANPLPVGGANIHPQDLVIVFVVGGWAFTSLIYRLRGELLPAVPASPAFGWPLAAFAVLIVIPLIRGHFAYGASFVGQPLRLFAYAAIVIALAGTTPARLYRLLLWLFYGGALVSMGWAAYYIAAGRSQTLSVDLSTGGTRPLAISTSLYCAGTLFLALLTVRKSPRRASNLLHLAMAALGLTGVVLGFGRGVFAAVAVVLLVFVVSSSGVRRAVLYSLPLALPFIALLAILIVRTTPSLVSSFEDRISASPSRDANVVWREKANEAVLAQVREQPIVGVGFGRDSSFFLTIRSSNGYLVPFQQDIGQDPHDGYLFLLAGGGVLALGSFLVVIGVFGVDAIRRYLRTPDDTERLLILWSAATLFCFLFEAASGTMFEDTTDLLAIWALIAIPGVVPLRARRPTAGLPAIEAGSAA